MDNRNVIEVFTNKSTDFMLDYGGSASWVINLARTASLQYCVCSRNDQPPREDDGGDRSEKRNEAFLVGKISGFEFVENQNGRDRYLIRFSEFAAVSVPSFRDGTKRNPVAYSDLESCAERGLDIARLEFKSMPSATRTYHRARSVQSDMDGAREGINIAQAKAGLAVYFDVPVEAINITISG